MQRPFSPVQIYKSLVTILPYFRITFAVVLGTIILGMALAILLFAQKQSKKRWARAIAEGYINIIRCTPSIVLLFIVYYGIPKIALAAFNINLNFSSKIIYVIISLSLIYAATLAEVIRSAYLALGRAQYEAALSVGLSPAQAICRVMLPQGIVVALPNLGNSLISLFKEGSLAFTIGLIDMMGAGNLIISRNYGAYSLETYLALAIIYWSLTLIIEQIFLRLEKHYSKGRRSLDAA